MTLQRKEGTIKVPVAAHTPGDPVDFHRHDTDVALTRCPQLVLHFLERKEILGISA
jgi:hypothetical protein